jgi:perosamine synthetase
MTGSFGAMGCFSFYANKVITTGEGGMVTTNDAALADELRLLRNLAFQQPRFLHAKAGFNFRMTGYQAAMGSAQLARIDWVIERKREIAQAYNAMLREVPGLHLPVEKDWARNVYWMYSVQLLPEFPMSRDELMPFLRERGVDARTFFCPMNLQPFLHEQEGFRAIDCPVAEEMWRSGLYLPCSLQITDAEMETVVAAVAQAAGV